MKKQLLLISFACLAMVCLPACEDLFDVEETFTFEHEFSVNSDQTSFESADVIDLSASADIIGEYGSKIKEVRVEQLEIWLKSFNGSDTQHLENALIAVSEAGGSGSGYSIIAEMENLHLQSLLDSPVVLQTEKSGQEALEKLATSPPHRFRLHLNASADESPVDFTAVVKVTATMVANPLN